MKILWFTNTPMPDMYKYHGKDSLGTGGWMGALLELVESIGFDVLKIGVFYAIEPFPLVQNYGFKQCLFESRRPRPKRIALLCLLLFVPPFNLAARMLRLFGNNVVIIARKK